MFQYNSSTNPCSTILSQNNGNSNFITNNQSPANCYRPLQQLYKTVYTPVNGNNSSQINFACICRPAERYKTTNMSYGSFYYDNSISTEKDGISYSQKNRALDYDRAIFARCYGTPSKLGSQSTSTNGPKDITTIFNKNDPQENQYWTQPTSDACCPTDCCNNTIYYSGNCTKYSNNDPCSTPISSSLNKPDTTYNLYK